MADAAKSGKKSQKRGDEPTNGGKHGALPPVRQSGRITVSFTPRSFTTPMRESKVDEEEAVSFLREFPSAEFHRLWAEVS